MSDRLRDAAVSDVLGSIFLVGITVTLVGAAAMQMTPSSDTQDVLPRLALLAHGEEGATHISVLHAGGGQVSAADLRAIVLVDGTQLYDGPAASAGNEWGLGTMLDIGPLSQALAGGSRVSLMLVHESRGVTVGSADVIVSQNALRTVTALTGFSVDIALAGGLSQLVVEPPANLLIEATVSHPQGRKFVRFVYADLAGLDGVRWVNLHDDGEGGDAIAGDGKYSGHALIPTNLTSGSAQVSVSAVDFEGVRTSASGGINLINRVDVTERALNPTGAPIADAQLPGCPAGNGAITNYRYIVNNATGYSSLGGRLRQGDHVQAVVTIATGCTAVPVSLASYTMPSSRFDWLEAVQGELYQAQTALLSAGEHVLTVNAPPCYFQVDLVRGPPISTFGPANTNNYYSRQGVLLDADNGGVNACLTN